jgi:hypothetical protein
MTALVDDLSRCSSGEGVTDLAMAIWIGRSLVLPVKAWQISMPGNR